MMKTYNGKCPHCEKDINIELEIQDDNTGYIYKEEPKEHSILVNLTSTIILMCISVLALVGTAKLIILLIG